MKKILIPIFILSIVFLGFSVYKNAELKRQQEINQVFNDDLHASPYMR